MILYLCGQFRASLGIEAAQVLSVSGWLVPDFHYRETQTCVYGCERRQCQTFPLTHRGQTNALISSWHTATTFLPLALPASPPPPFFSLLLHCFASNLSLCLCLLRTDRHNTFVSPFTQACCYKAHHWCRMKPWGSNWLWLLACWSVREFVKGGKKKKGTARGKHASHLLHISA